MARILLFVVLGVLALAQAASANVCATNTDGRTAICGEEAGQCLFQAIWGGDTTGPHEATQPGNICCYDPDEFQCGAGAFLVDDETPTPVLAPREWNRRDLDLCGVVSNRGICTMDVSCGVLGYDFMCPITRICANQGDICPEATPGPCAPPNDRECGGACYDFDTHFCFESVIYSKETHFKCGDDGLFEVEPTVACCNNRRAYNPQSQGCCGDGIFSRATEACCGGRETFATATNDCSAGRVVAPGMQWSRQCRAEFDPQTQYCAQGRPPFPRFGICNIGEEYRNGACFVPAAGEIGESCVANDACASGRCQGGTCVCRDDADCAGGQFCNNRPGAPNRCLAEGSLLIGQACNRNRECASAAARAARAFVRTTPIAPVGSSATTGPARPIDASRMPRCRSARAATAIANAPRTAAMAGNASAATMATARRRSSAIRAHCRSAPISAVRTGAGTILLARRAVRNRLLQVPRGTREMPARGSLQLTGHPP